MRQMLSEGRLLGLLIECHQSLVFRLSCLVKRKSWNKLGIVSFV